MTVAVMLFGMAASMGGCECNKTQEGELPSVEVKGGQMPKYDVDGPEVDVKTEKKTIEVPDVDVHTEKKTIEVPDVDVKLPD